MELKAIIVEDEANSREILANYLKKYCPQIKLLGEADSIKQAKEIIDASEPDLVFLDVEMPFGNAFDLLEQLPDRNFEAVFVTAYDHYALQALNEHAAYYLMKPINIDELVKAVEHVEGIKEKEIQLKGKVLQTSYVKSDGKITIPQLDGFSVLEVKDIFFCKADDNYTEIYLKDKKVVVSKTLKHFEDILLPFHFARIHKSYLVNLNEVVKYTKGKGGMVTLSNNVELSVSATRKAAFLSHFQ